MISMTFDFDVLIFAFVFNSQLIAEIADSLDGLC